MCFSCSAFPHVNRFLCQHAFLTLWGAFSHAGVSGQETTADGELLDGSMERKAQMRITALCTLSLKWLC